MMTSSGEFTIEIFIALYHEYLSVAVYLLQLCSLPCPSVVQVRLLLTLPRLKYLLPRFLLSLTESLRLTQQAARESNW